MSDYYSRVVGRTTRRGEGDGVSKGFDLYPTYYVAELEATATRRLELLVRAMNALEGWRILLDMPITDIMIDIEKELKDEL